MTELTQAEINRLELDEYEAKCAREDAADLLMWSLRTLKQNSPSFYAAVSTAAAAGAITDFDDLVDAWIDASRRETAARRAAWTMSCVDDDDALPACGQATSIP